MRACVHLPHLFLLVCLWKSDFFRQLFRLDALSQKCDNLVVFPRDMHLFTSEKSREFKCAFLWGEGEVKGLEPIW